MTMQLGSNAKTYPAGVPCWVDTLQPDPHAATAFYTGLFGWELAGPGAMPDGGAYFVARLGGDDVAGIAALPAAAGSGAAWTTYVRVDDVDDAVARAVRAGGRAIVPPLDAPPAGRLAVLEDPAHAVIGVWQARLREGAQRVNEPGAWAMSMLRTPDFARACAFYAEVFGWDAMPFDAGPARAALFRLPGYVGGTPEQPVPRDVVAAVVACAADETPHWSVDFWIDDVDAAVARAERLGGTVPVAPFDEGLFRRAVVTDPAGATFTLSELMPERLGARS
jgi:hypothetical protein